MQQTCSAFSADGSACRADRKLFLLGAEVSLRRSLPGRCEFRSISLNNSTPQRTQTTTRGTLALAPATAHATDNNPTTGGGGCTYIDKDGYPIPLDDGVRTTLTEPPASRPATFPPGGGPYCQLGGAGLIEPMK
jgi:hypothetical protein